MNDVLLDNNKKMKSMDNDLGNTVGDVDDINAMLGETNVMLTD